MGQFTPRDYQREAFEAVDIFMRHKRGNPCIELPTGAGKTIVMADICERYVTQWPNTRIAVVAHVKELVQQNAVKLYRHWPEAPIGVNAASLNSRDTQQAILFCSIQSVYKKAGQVGPFDLIIVDEAHRIPLRAEGMYRQFIGDIQAMTPHCRVIGLTATPYRLKGGLVCGRDHVLNEICYSASITRLMDAGYLCRPISKKPEPEADIEGVGMSGGDYNKKALDDAVNQNDLIKQTCRDMLKWGQDRKAWIVFCTSVDHAENVSAELNGLGISTRAVHSRLSKEARAEAIGQFQRGDLRALTNVNVLTEGFDAPHIDLVAMLRPTKSPGLYYQSVGRGFRIHEGKKDFLVLDYAGNILEHGPIDCIQVRGPKKKGSGDAPAKACPECKEVVAAGFRECPECGFVFPESDKPKHDTEASSAPVLSTDIPQPEWFDVDRILYDEHIAKKSGRTMLLVQYECGLRTFNEYVGFEHSGYMRGKAINWWLSRYRGLETPHTVDAALQACIQGQSDFEVDRICVDESGKYPEIIRYDMREVVLDEVPF